MAAHAILVFFSCSLMAIPNTSTHPSSTPSALERPEKGDSVPPTVMKEVPLSQGRKQEFTGLLTTGLQIRITDHSQLYKVRLYSGSEK